MSRWSQWSETFAKLSSRERAITAFTVCVGGCFLLYNFLLEPGYLKSRLTVKDLATQRAELEQQRSLLGVRKNTPVGDPDAANRQKLEQVKEQLAAINTWIMQFESSLIPPTAMPGVLQGLLAQHRGVQLLGFKTLPPQALGTTNAASPNATGAAKGDPQVNAPVEGIYEHAVELRLAGSYNDLLAYIASLERLPQRLMWSNATLTVDGYPRNTLVLKVYTLSFDSNWLMV